MDIRKTNEQKEIYLSLREVEERLPGSPAAQTVRAWCSQGS